MSCARLFRFRRWVKRIGKQEQAVASLRIVGSQERRLTAAVGVASGKRCFGEGTQCVEGGAHTRAIVCGAAWMRRSKGTAPAKRQVEAQHEEACRAERLRDRDQQRSSAISACAVREGEAGAARFGRMVQEPANV